MGIDLQTARFLTFCKTLEVSYDKTVTLGRQSLYVEKRDAAALFRHLDPSINEAKLNEIFGTSSSKDGEVGFAEGFFTALGASSVDAIDASGYEGASIVHDMNKPIPDEYAGRFSVVMDGGTLEHIFNFPLAIENCMRLVRTGGHFISVAPANNYFGHGFYQFGSELFFRIFSDPNGFRVIRVFLSAEKSFGTWYEVPDPASLRERVYLRNQVPTLQLFVAEKTADDAGLHVCPQQSDYSDVLWEGSKNENWTAHGDAALLQRTAIYRKALSYVPRDAAQFVRASRALVMGAITPPFNHGKLRKFRP